MVLFIFWRGKGEGCVCVYVCVICFPMVELYTVEKDAVSEKEVYG